MKTVHTQFTEKLKSKNLLSIYLTAGFPSIEKSLEVLIDLENYGVDFVELGMPFSDPLADGKTIQMSSEKAILKGMTMNKYFELAANARKFTQIPLVYMGYLNPILQYGVDEFCEKCSEVRIDCVILPDLPVDLYEKDFKAIFEKYNLPVSFLITPTTSDERIRLIEKQSTGFIYVVSSNSITGKQGDMDEKQLFYFKRLEALKLSKSTIIGFGIHDRTTFDTACKYANGAIIGSEFIRRLSDDTYKEFLLTLKD